MRPARFCSSTLQQRLRQESNLTNELRKLVPGIRQDEGNGLPARSRTWHKCFRRTPPGIRQDEEMSGRFKSRKGEVSNPIPRRVRTAFEAVLTPSQFPFRLVGPCGPPHRFAASLPRSRASGGASCYARVLLAGRDSNSPHFAAWFSVRTAGVEPAISSPPDWRFCQLSYALHTSTDCRSRGTMPASTLVRSTRHRRRRVSGGRPPREAWRGPAGSQENRGPVYVVMGQDAGAHIVVRCSRGTHAERDISRARSPQYGCQSSGRSPSSRRIGGTTGSDSGLSGLRSSFIPASSGVRLPLRSLQA